MSVQQHEPSTSAALMSRQPEPETVPLKPKKTLPPPTSTLRAQLTPVIAVSACTAVVLGATAFWATSYAAEPLHKAVEGKETNVAAVVVRDAADSPARVFVDVRAAVERGESAGTTFESLAASIRVAPEGSWNSAGLMLLGVTEKSPARRAGLQGGDQIVRVNGFSLNQRNGGPEMYEALRDQNVLYLDVVRNGQERSIHFNVHDAVADRGTP